MSASKSKTKETSQQQQTSSGTATTTPNTPDWLAQPWQQQVGNISALQQSGQPLIAGAQPLQQQAFSAASKLTGDGRMVNGGPDGTNGFDLAQSLGLGAAQAPANTSTAQGYSASGPAAVQGYRPSQASNVTIDPAALAQSGKFTDVNLAGYLNPYTSEVQDAYTADFDANAGRVRAQQAALQAANGGMRNSRNAILQAATEGELSRARGAGVAGIRSDGFNTAAGLATNDLNRDASTSQFNAGQQNSRSALQAQLEQAGIFANQNANNQAAQFGANAGNAAAMDYTGRTDVASQFGAGAQNQVGMFNAGQQDQALARQFEAAGLIGNLSSAQGANDRANIGLQADLGGQQRDIANSQSQAANLALIQQLLGGVPLDAFVGSTENRNATGNSTGTGTSSSSGFGFNLADLWAASNSGGR